MELVEALATRLDGKLRDDGENLLGSEGEWMRQTGLDENR